MECKNETKEGTCKSELTYSKKMDTWYCRKCCSPEGLKNYEEDKEVVLWASDDGLGGGSTYFKQIK